MTAKRDGASVPSEASKPGPSPKRVRIDGPWEEAVKRALTKPPLPKEKSAARPRKRKAE